ncbi:hypothetical protein GGF31_003418 [Allomyces arbusculus]|nr:hypothetical protein GGF31_003418 [Allomyces arbusculus]
MAAQIAQLQAHFDAQIADLKAENAALKTQLQHQETMYQQREAALLVKNAEMKAKMEKMEAEIEQMKRDAIAARQFNQNTRNPVNESTTVRKMTDMRRQWQSNGNA